MVAVASSVESLTFTLTQEIHVRSSITTAFNALLLERVPSATPLASSSKEFSPVSPSRFVIANFLPLGGAG